MMQAGFRAVDFHSRIHHCAVKIQADPLPLPFPGNLCHPAVAGDPSGIEAAGALCRRVFPDVGFNHIVVGKIHQPFFLCQSRPGLQHSMLKLPAPIDVDLFHTCCSSLSEGNVHAV